MTLKAANRIGRRAPLSLRTTEALREKLEQAASASGRSLTAELERRLELSFEWEKAFRDAETYKAEFKRQMEEAEAGNLHALLFRAKWPKIAATRYGTIYIDPDSPKPSDFGEGENADDLMPKPAASEGTIPAPELSTTIEEAVVRALKRVLPPSLTNRPSREGLPDLRPEDNG